jgi:hypothetical protein
MGSDGRIQRRKRAAGEAGAEVVYERVAPDSADEGRQAAYVISATALGEAILMWSAPWLAGLFSIIDLAPYWSQPAWASGEHAGTGEPIYVTTAYEQIGRQAGNEPTRPQPFLAMLPAQPGRLALPPAN